MAKPDTSIVKAMVTYGHANDLANLMIGVSPYNLDLKENIPSGDRKTLMSQLHTIRMALEHITFVAKFGVNVSKAKEDNKFYSAYPEYFEKWIASGCLGIHQEEITLFLDANPKFNGENFSDYC